jgi:hypothetical protein
MKPLNDTRLEWDPSLTGDLLLPAQDQSYMEMWCRMIPLPSRGSIHLSSMLQPFSALHQEKARTAYCQLKYTNTTGSNRIRMYSTLCNTSTRNERLHLSTDF